MGQGHVHVDRRHRRLLFAVAGLEADGVRHVLDAHAIDRDIAPIRPALHVLHGVLRVVGVLALAVTRRVLEGERVAARLETALAGARLALDLLAVVERIAIGFVAGRGVKGLKLNTPAGFAAQAFLDADAPSGVPAAVDVAVMGELAGSYPAPGPRIELEPGPRHAQRHAAEDSRQPVQPNRPGQRGQRAVHRRVHKVLVVNDQRGPWAPPPRATRRPGPGPRPTPGP